MISAAVIEEISRQAKSRDKGSKVGEFRRQNCRIVNCPNVDDDISSPCVEELWSFGKKLEWKRSGRLLQAFTGEGEILEAIWADFMPTLTCIVIRETERLRIYAESGEEFLVKSFLACVYF
jgi:hypothetical protein